MPIRLIFGKSVVSGTSTGDVFEGITPNPAAYVRARGYEAPAPGLTFELGGPWAFYRQFWPAHNIEHLANLYAPEAQVIAGQSLWVPLLIRNDTDMPKQVSLHSLLPQGWKEQPAVSTYRIAAHDWYAAQFWISSSSSQPGTWQDLIWETQSEGKKIGSVKLRVKVESNGLPQ